MIMKKILLACISLLALHCSMAQNPFGVLVNASGGPVNIQQKIAIAKDLGVPYVRNAIIMDTWSGSDKAYEAYEKAGFKIICNVNYGRVQKGGQRGSVPFPTDMTAYKKTLHAILDKYKPEVVVIENEELIPKYHSGSMQDYITELT